jgi:hypothetical protein
MPPVTFETFDPTPYQRAPRLNILKTLALGRALVQAMPEEPSEAVERTAASLERMLDEGDEAVDTRRQESVPVDLAAEVAFDGVADGLWGVFRNRLDALGGFEHEGLPRVAEGHGKRSVVALAVAAAQDKAARARKLSTRLLGGEGLAFTKTQFAEQAQAMASILRVIDKDGLAGEIDELVGPESLILLRACQPKYEAMVETRLTRDARKSGDLGKVRGKVMRAVARYTNAVLTMLDESKPESLEVVIAALRPLDQLRAGAAVGAASVAEPVAEVGLGDGADEDEDEDEDEPA